MPPIKHRAPLRTKKTVGSVVKKVAGGQRLKRQILASNSIILGGGVPGLGPKTGLGPSRAIGTKAPAAAAGRKMVKKIAVADVVEVTGLAQADTQAVLRSLEPMRGQMSELGLPLKVESLIEVFGSASAVASLLGVSKSQPTRWRKGDERPGPQVERLLLDLEHVVARAGQVFQKPVIMDWLLGSNSYLNGARPIDVLTLQGSGPVVEALDAGMQGAY